MEDVILRKWFDEVIACCNEAVEQSQCRYFDDPRNAGKAWSPSLHDKAVIKAVNLLRFMVLREENTEEAPKA